MSDGATKARCVECREDIAVTDAYAHGDHIACGTCGTKHKVVRGDKVRLVLADVGPLREALAQNQQTVNRIKAEMAQARASFGIGANGVGVGVIFAIYQVGWKGEEWSMNLLWNAIGIAIVAGLLLEAANWAFLAKRQALTRLAGELEETQQEARRLRQKVRDATRV